MLLTQTAEQGANGKRSNPSNKKQAAAPTQRLKLIDFGEANITINADRIEVGTPGYMAPEVMTDGDCTAASDIYSAGASLVELWSGGIWAGAETRGEGYDGMRQELLDVSAASSLPLLLIIA